MLYDPKWEAPVETKPIEPWRKLLLDAAAVIERRGHTKHVTGDKLGRVCLFGALNTAHHGHSDYLGAPESTYPEATDAICKLLGVHSPYEAADWNNAFERTPEDVIAALRNAAAEKTNTPAP